MASVDVRQAFGRRVRELRLQQKLSQEALAERADLHWTYVSGIERGERNPALINLTYLARALGVSLGELFAPVNGSPPKKAARRGKH